MKYGWMDMVRAAFGWRATLTQDALKQLKRGYTAARREDALRALLEGLQEASADVRRQMAEDQENDLRRSLLPHGYALDKAVLP